MKEPRYYSNKLLELVDEELLDARDTLLSLIKWCSEDDIKEFMKVNGLVENSDLLGLPEELEIPFTLLECDDEAPNDVMHMMLAKSIENYLKETYGHETSELVYRMKDSVVEVTNIIWEV